MSSNLRRARLQDIARIVMGQSPKGETCNENGIGIPLLNGPSEFQSFHPIPVQFTTDGKRYCESGDVLFCVRGSTTGRMNWADQKYALGRGLASLSHKKNKELNHFLKYLIDYNLSSLLKSTSGSTFPNLTSKILSEFEFVLPDDETVIHVNRFLKLVDEKIVLNNRINTELEGMAKLLYDYWFVQFDFPDENGQPYKSSGGEMVYNARLKREIPVGWEVKKLADWIANDKSGDWGKEEEEGNYIQKVSCIRGADLNGLNGTGELKAPTRFILEKNRHKLLDMHDLIVEISGGSPTQSTGRLSYITQSTLDRFENPLICSNFCKALTLNGSGEIRK